MNYMYCTVCTVCSVCAVCNVCIIIIIVYFKVFVTDLTVLSMHQDYENTVKMSSTQGDLVKTCEMKSLNLWCTGFW